MDMPRSEYPRPQFVRKDWLCLNGPWQFEMDMADSGLERGLLQRELTGQILVPFCPESTLSGVGHIDFITAAWYRRQVTIPADWAGRAVLLHFGAVDHDAMVWVNGKEVGRHRGGYTPFTCDLSGVAGGGEQITIVVRAQDYRDRRQARGKQCGRYANHGCLYTRTTGIWQTVWMEPVPLTHLLRPRITPNVAGGSFVLEQPIAGSRRGMMLRATLRDAGGEVCQAHAAADGDFSPRLDLAIPAARRRLWSPQDPHLYDVEIELLDAAGRVVDRASSYAGLRSVVIDGKAIHLNGQAVFQRLVLDQGFYPDGIYTAPTDAALRRDIELSIQAGFNGARLHEKVFEERFLYHADRMGYLCWGEFPDWCAIPGVGRKANGDPSYITQWIEALDRDYSHPCIVGWCGMNETAETLSDRINSSDDMVRGMFLAAKAMDKSRPVLDVSGYTHRVDESDVYDCHNYKQDVQAFVADIAGTGEGKVFSNDKPGVLQSVPYRGQPFFVSEFGGIWWNPNAKPGDASWGYGQRPTSIEEFYQRFEGLCAAQLDNPHLFGYCYTQLTDVYQEQNGIYDFARQPKFDMQRIAKAQTRPAAIERIR